MQDMHSNVHVHECACRYYFTLTQCLHMTALLRRVFLACCTDDSKPADEALGECRPPPSSAFPRILSLFAPVTASWGNLVASP